MSGSKILASAHYVPSDIVTNDDLAKIMDTNDEWIQVHTGIKTRHMSLQGENTSDLATQAARLALAQTNLTVEEIDLIIVTTFTPDGLAPSTAALVQRNLKATNAWAYDISTACSGFVFGVSTADKFLRSGVYKNALVISAEVNSKMMDFKDRTSTVFFGDGAGAVVMTATQGTGVLSKEEMHTIGNENVVHSGRIAPLTSLSVENYPKTDAFAQQGREVFNEVTTLIPQHIKDFLGDKQLLPKDIDYYIPHQANLRLIEYIAEALNEPMAKFSTNIIQNGNTSSAGIAIGFDELNQTVDLTGKRVLLTGFGAGFTYGSLLLEF
ncbi:MULTISPECIES: beta-ketoacyl-ACP synthase III [Leuconostoc]|jgi:3-oxoacyl-[acyl-carrier-protein] synthase III|uniref:beta-ketoacyl-ACP synthase III n=1 Tax=Leuconostoc TaxID=1243 RepID=UPI0011DDE70C|nr:MULTISPECIES: beta-ketoacyl-ACP synthase III [Leuconostoc]MBK0041056.1 ketoacyl-ACP synthase III [Leuconostoc sp. S51]MBK0052005.1 ketoacyl-ACP synthase III [Leuconostoc sp. S50]MBS0958000.1 ketoacyl-ACP synthase III [Leuconostoc pseudomesenteroides]MCT4380152.1 ketoacyl-ACP synthase III [Leuconostoc pseudomesenteroides]MCT4412797.1 ketoacyl-ACP synthase III [Leuconostoc pseudomesenteroides]